MRFPTLFVRLSPALIVTFTLCACGGGSEGGFFSGLPVATPTTPTPPDTTVKPEMRCAP